MKSGIEPPWRTRPEDLAAVVEQARDAGRAQAFEIVERDDMALGREKHRDGIADDLALVVAEQRLGRTVEGEDAAGLVEHDDAVGRRVENGLELLDRGCPAAAAGSRLGRPFG